MFPGVRIFVKPSTRRHYSLSPIEPRVNMPTLCECVEALLVDPGPHVSPCPQITHRFGIFKSWLGLAYQERFNLESEIIGKRSLDIGCGQGDTIEAFAAALKHQGNKESRVTGVDPGRLDYGDC